MPKIRTKKGAMKRFKLTANKNVKRKKAFTSHILTKKTSKRKRHLRKAGLVDATQERRVKRMMGV